MTFLIIITTLLAALLTWAVLQIGRKVLFSVTRLHDPVFVPTTDEKLATMLELAEITQKDKVLDLGSGDGKIVCAVAEQGYTAEGVEINPLLVLRSYLLARKLGVQDKVTFTRGSFWNVDYSQYDVLLFYGTSYIMERLEKKLQQEMKPGARIVSNRFQFPNWKPQVVQDDVRVYVR